MKKLALLPILFSMNCLVFSSVQGSEVLSLKDFEGMSYRELENMLVPPRGVSLGYLEQFYGPGERLLDGDGKEYLSFPFFSGICLEIRLSPENRVAEAQFNHHGGLSDYSSTSLDLISLIKNPESNKKEEAEVWFKNGYLHTIQSWYLLGKGLPLWFKEQEEKARGAPSPR